MRGLRSTASFVSPVCDNLSFHLYFNQRATARVTKTSHTAAHAAQRDAGHFLGRASPQGGGWQLAVQGAVISREATEIAEAVSPRDLRDAGSIRSSAPQGAV